MLGCDGVLIDGGELCVFVLVAVYGVRCLMDV